MIADESKSRGHGDKRARRLDQFIAAILTHSSVEAAARAAGIGRATAHRWLRDPVVVRRLAEARRDSMARAIARLQEAATEAVECLCRVQREGESESARVSAARCILEQALRAAELQDLEERVNKLEGMAKLRWRESDYEQPDYAQGRTARNANGAA